MEFDLMSKGPHAVLSSPFHAQSADVQQHILQNCSWILFADGSAAQRCDGVWAVLIGAVDRGGEAEEFVNVQRCRQTSNDAMERRSTFVVST
jgi:hypothetical protein